MTPEQLAEIQARLAAATPGPWKQEQNTRIGAMTEVTAFDPDDPPTPWDVATTYRFCGRGKDECEANAALIAHAPADLAALLAYVEQLEGLLRDLCEDSRAAAEVVRLRKVIEEAAEDLSVLSRKVYKDSPADSFLLLRSVSYLSSALTPEGRSLGSLK